MVTPDGASKGGRALVNNIEQDKSLNFFDGNMSRLKLGRVVQVHLVDSPIKIQTSVMDIDIGSFILLKIVSTEDKGALVKDAAVFATFLSSGVIYSFRSKIMDIVEKPIDFIIIDYPETVEEYSMRSHKRVECILPANVVHEGVTLDGTITNISLGGCKLTLKKEYSSETGIGFCSNFQLGSEVFLLISMHHANEHLQIHGIIKNIAQEKFDKCYGIQFIDSTEFVKQSLNDYIHTIERIEQDHYFLYTLHSILQISMEDISFEEQLDRVLSLILSLPGLSTQSGCLFIYDESAGALAMKVSRGLSDDQIRICTSVPWGRCLCGMALATGEVVFTDSLDSRHTSRYSKMIPHGDYCVPIKLRDKPLGVINIHVREGFCRDKGTENYLISVANALSGMIDRNMSRKRLEELVAQLQSANDDLKQSQEQLVHSEKMRSLGQLVAGVAHEINNPLGFLITNMNKLMEFVNSFVKLIETFSAFEIPVGIRVELDAIKKGCNYDYIRGRTPQMIGRSKIGLDRIKKIVLDLKTYSRMDRAEVLDTDINESIAVTINLLTHEFGDRISVVTDYGTIPLIRCYSSQLNQVFMNILINSCQAIEAKGEIRIMTHEENGIILIEISDNGNGIPPGIRDRIFDPFFTTRPVGSGTGLGLSTSLGIVKKHNGGIEVESTEGTGSTFTIKLPINNALY
ncbi:ATP-binding protein [Candidatus Magnetominusculus dajiuhuensis]|uniref:ATP-binding protein n=1 Tax=Candidatus Magnetominusculus dajiuhuensis TaxID=3137712 RepID=UPI003B42C9DF